MAEKDAIQIVVITGSVRPGNATSMAAALVVDELKKNDGVSVTLVEPSDLKLPLPGTPDESGQMKQLQETVTRATGLVLATPEYHGSFSSVMKLVIENLGFPSVISGKPVALLGVAAGAIGAVKSLEHLRSVCSHIGAIVLPGPVSVAGVGKVFDADGRCTDAGVEKRIRGAATGLVDYIRKSLCPRIALERMVREGTA